MENLYWTQHSCNVIVLSLAVLNRAKDEVSSMTKKAELKDKDVAESKRESVATGNSFEWKTGKGHQQVAPLR